MSLAKAIAQYEKDFIRQREDSINDTLSTAVCNVKFCLDDVIRGLTEKAELIQRDLVEPLDLYYKHYSSTNNELLK